MRIPGYSAAGWVPKKKRSGRKGTKCLQRRAQNLAVGEGSRQEEPSRRSYHRFACGAVLGSPLLLPLAILCCALSPSPAAALDGGRTDLGWPTPEAQRPRPHPGGHALVRRPRPLAHASWRPSESPARRPRPRIPTAARRPQPRLYTPAATRASWRVLSPAAGAPPSLCVCGARASMAQAVFSTFWAPLVGKKA